MFYVFWCFSVVLFFKQKTAYEMRIGDWSSDVCSSDLAMQSAQIVSYPDRSRRLLITGAAILAVLMVTLDGTIAVIALPHMQSTLGASQDQIARDRKSVVEGKRMSVS